MPPNFCLEKRPHMDVNMFYFTKKDKKMKKMSQNCSFENKNRIQKDQICQKLSAFQDEKTPVIGPLLRKST